MGLFGRLRESLARTKRQLVERFEGIVARADAPDRRAQAIDAETLEALEELLIAADVGLPATGRIIAAVKSRPRRGESLRDLVKQEIRAVFDAVSRPVTGPSEPALPPAPRVVLIVGVNGTGKTTTVGKLANLLRVSGERPLVCAADTFRAAAVAQLEILGGARRRRHRPGKGRRGSGCRRIRRDLLGQGPGTVADPDRYGRPHSHARQPHERAGEDPARGGARSAGRAA